MIKVHTEDYLDMTALIKVHTKDCLDKTALIKLKVHPDERANSCEEKKKKKEIRMKYYLDVSTLTKAHATTLTKYHHDPYHEVKDDLGEMSS